VLVGDPSTFAIESVLVEAYDTPSLLGLGFFAVHINGHSYGQRGWASTHLAGPFGGVKRRIADRGKHTAPFSQRASAEEIAHAFRNAFYAEQQEVELLGLNLGDFEQIIVSNQLADWQEDAAFDDGSYILHFDLMDKVRLIAFKSWSHDDYYDPETLQDLWMQADIFYAILQQWQDLFCNEWEAAPKERHSVTLLQAKHSH
jgi:hypothetical protein